MSFKFEVITSNNKDWKKYVETCESYDFYHTQEYHKIEQGKNKSLLFVGHTSEYTIALPLIIRPIPYTEWLDATSVYGYAGPITSEKIENIDVSFVNIFKENLQNYFNDNKIVTVFSRLHPLVDEPTCFFDDFGVCQEINKTVSIDLTISLEEQRRAYRKSNKYEINQLKKKGFTVSKAQTAEDLKCFIAIYNQTMDRVNADKRYYFDESYYQNFLDNDDFDSVLLIAKKENVICAGAIFTITRSIMQYHLAGTREDYMKERPMKLILDHARLLANELGLKNLHLGGGVGGSDEDSLFRFKSGFSKNFKLFKVWKLISDKEKYNKLINEIDIKSDASFFPLYRKK